MLDVSTDWVRQNLTMAIVIALREDEVDAFENVMSLRRIDALQLHKHGPLVVPPAPVLEHRCIVKCAMSVAISDFELVFVLAERGLLVLTFELCLNYKVCGSVVVLWPCCGDWLFLFLLLLLWSINGNFSELGDLLLSFLPELWVCLFLESLHVLVGNCEFKRLWWHESAHRALPLKVHTCLRASLTEDMLAWEDGWPHHDHHADCALRSNLEINILHRSHLCFLCRHAFDFFFLLCNTLLVSLFLFVSEPSQPFTFLDS